MMMMTTMIAMGFQPSIHMGGQAIWRPLKWSSPGQIGERLALLPEGLKNQKNVWLILEIIPKWP